MILLASDNGEKMNNQKLFDAFRFLSTPLVADGCIRLDLPLRLAPPGIRPPAAECRTAGHAVPVRHYGSVDIFLEAMGNVDAGDVLVIDNGGRLDEGCIGDLTALEARASGLAAMVVWGVHRDTAELLTIGLPVFSYGAYPSGPVRLDPREAEALVTARFGPHLVRRGDIVFGDADGVIFVPGERVEDVLRVAGEIQHRERQQADAVRAGHPLRQQFQFDLYLERRAAEPTYTFRKHLRRIGGAIEE